MPCSEKWLQNTQRRIPMRRRGRGIGKHPLGIWRGRRPQPVRENVRYRPGAPPVVYPGLQYSWLAMQNGRYVPATILGARPIRRRKGPPNRPCRDKHTPWWDTMAENWECDSVHRGHLVPAGIGQRESSSARRRRKRRRGEHGVGVVVGCDPRKGRNPYLTGCATSTRPQAGLFWGFQNRGAPGRPGTHHHRQGRRSPYPVLQQPYWVGKSAPYFQEPFAGTPTRSVPYVVEPGYPGHGPDPEPCVTPRLKYERTWGPEVNPVTGLGAQQGSAEQRFQRAYEAAKRRRGR